MCRMASGLFRPDTMQVLVADLTSHSETQKAHGLGPESDGPAPNGWREFHYTPEGEIECRTLACDARAGDEARAEILRRWPTFIDFFNWAIREPKFSSMGPLDLSGRTLTLGEAEEDAK